MIVQLPLALEPSVKAQNLRSVGGGMSLGEKGAGGNFAEALARARQEEPATAQIADQDDISDIGAKPGNLPAMPRLTQQAHSALTETGTQTSQRQLGQACENPSAAATPDAETGTDAATEPTPRTAAQGQAAPAAAQPPKSAGHTCEAKPAGAQRYRQQSGSAALAAPSPQTSGAPSPGQSAPQAVPLATAADVATAAAAPSPQTSDASTPGQSAQLAAQVADAADIASAAQPSAAATQPSASADVAAPSPQTADAPASGQPTPVAASLATAADAAAPPQLAGTQSLPQPSGPTDGAAPFTAQAPEGNGQHRHALAARPAQGTAHHSAAPTPLGGDEAVPAGQIPIQTQPALQTQSTPTAPRVQPAEAAATPMVAAADRSAPRRADESLGALAGVSMPQSLASSIPQLEAVTRSPAASQADFEQSLTNWLTSAATHTAKAETRLVFTDPATPLASAQFRRDADGTVHIDISGASNFGSSDQIDKLRRRLTERGLNAGEITYTVSDSLQAPVDASVPQ